ncbi:Velvet complex subunit B [Fusarium oxysporum f. sp. albedinis]|nr:Velvet complex subunit B [Fusarium oxysporum f. sp. albedinis]
MLTKASSLIHSSISPIHHHEHSSFLHISTINTPQKSIEMTPSATGGNANGAPKEEGLGQAQCVHQSSYLAWLVVIG